jgi:hypothetical protein
MDVEEVKVCRSEYNVTGIKNEEEPLVLHITAVCIFLVFFIPQLHMFL